MRASPIPVRIQNPLRAIGWPGVRERMPAVASACIAPHFARSGGSFHSPGGDAEIGDRPIAVADDIGAGEPAFIFQGAVLQPVVEDRLAAIEAGQIMIGRQRNWRG